MQAQTLRWRKRLYTLGFGGESLDPFLVLTFRVYSFPHPHLQPFEGLLQKSGQKKDNSELITAIEDNITDESSRSDYIKDMKGVKLARHLTGVMKTEIQEKKVSLIVENDAVTLRFPEKSTFASGQAELQDEIRPTINRIADIISKTAKTDKIIVAGHTDSVPISTLKFRSNWELSSSRAVSVVHQILESSKIEKHRVEAVGHGDSHPVAENNTTENRALNRRVEIRIEMTDKLSKKP